MDVSLTPELVEFVNDKVRSGLYPTASEVICEGLRLLKEREELLCSDINSGFEAIRRGEFSEFEATTVHQLSEQVKERGRKRAGDTATVELLAGWRAEDATTDPEKLREADEKIAEFKKSMNSTRALNGARLIFP